MIWASPQWFWILGIIPILMALEIWRFLKKKHPMLVYSDTNTLYHIKGNWRSYGIWICPLFQWIAMTLMILALARPQQRNTSQELTAEGIDIMFVIDISSSMLAEDIKPNRFIAARDVAKEFIEERVSDRIGIVVFAAQSYTICPPTLDYELLDNLINEIKIGIIEDGTAIGMGIATAINRLKENNSKSKIIILLTDGQNNAGEIDPVTAADLAVTYGIKIYTIGAGTHGVAPYPINDPLRGKTYRNIRVNIDEEMLKNIANSTNGKYYRATDNNELKKIYKEINELERTEIEELIYISYYDLYEYYLLAGFVFLILSFLTNELIFRKGIG